MESVFKALSDPSRRLLLDRLFERDGQTLNELCRHLPGMTRFGVMRHLGVLEAADLVTTRRVGREKRHYLNPVPIRLVHDRWISKYAEPVVGSMSALKRHLEVDSMAEPQHVYAIYIHTTPGGALAGDHRRRRDRPLLLRHPGELRLAAGLGRLVHVCRRHGGRRR